MLILDTDVLSLIQRATGSRYQSVVTLLNESDEDVYVTVISLDEQIHGALSEIASNDSTIRIRGYRRLADLVIDYAERPMVGYDEKSEAVFDRLKGLKGRPGTKDLRIASIALSHDATLVTGNAKDFQNIPTLKLKAIR